MGRKFAWSHSLPSCTCFITERHNYAGQRTPPPISKQSHPSLILLLPHELETHLHPAASALRWRDFHHIRTISGRILTNRSLGSCEMEARAVIGVIAWIRNAFCVGLQCYYKYINARSWTFIRIKCLSKHHWDRESSKNCLLIIFVRVSFLLNFTTG